MIKIEMKETGITMEGHAGCSKNGRDLACAAASALTITLVNALNEFTDDHVEADLSDGHAVLKWKELSDKGWLLVHAWCIGIKGINESYKCITFV